MCTAQPLRERLAFGRLPAAAHCPACRVQISWDVEFSDKLWGCSCAIHVGTGLGNCSSLRGSVQSSLLSPPFLSCTRLLYGITSEHQAGGSGQGPRIALPSPGARSPGPASLRPRLKVSETCSQDGSGLQAHLRLDWGRIRAQRTAVTAHGSLEAA